MATFVSAYTPGADRNNFTGYVGMQFNMTNNLTVTTLGIRKATGNTGVHNVYLLNLSNATLASVGIDLTSGTVGTFYYGSISSTNLVAGSYYYILAQVTSGAQNWSDTGACTLSADGNTPYSCYTASLGTTPSFQSSGQMYYGVDANGAVVSAYNATQGFLML